MNAAMSMLYVFYCKLMVDPRVIQAWKFSRITSFRDLFKFIGFADDIRSPSQRHTEGHHLKVMRIYSGDAGCLTPQRPHSNVSEVTYETGIDIFVDGKPFQIKCFKYPAGRIRAIKKHLKDNPEG